MSRPQYGDPPPEVFDLFGDDPPSDTIADNPEGTTEWYSDMGDQRGLVPSVDSTPVLLHGDPRPAALVMVYPGELTSCRFEAPGPEWTFLDVREIRNRTSVKHIVIWEFKP